MHYGSDINVHGDGGTLSNPPVPELQPLTAPNPFVERGETTAPVERLHAADAGEIIITNPLDEQKELILQRDKSALRRSQTKRLIQNRSGYVFSTPVLEERLRQTEFRRLLT